MTCKYYANGACVADINNIHPCGHVSVGEGCCIREQESASCATFGQLGEVYCMLSDASVNRKILARMVADRFAKLLDRKTSDPADLNKQDYQIIVQRLMNGDHPFVDYRLKTKCGGGYDLSTIKCWMEMWRIMCGAGDSRLGEAQRKAFAAMKVRGPNTALIPKIRVPHKEVRELTDAEIQKLEDRIVMLRNSNDRRMRKLGLFLEIAIETGARTGDVAHARWSWFRQDADRGGWIYSYVPSKTRKHGIEAFGKLSQHFVSIMQSLRNDTHDDIFAEDNGWSNNGSKQKSSGNCSGRRDSLRQRACREIRSIVGNDGNAAVYLCRRLKSKRMLESEGFLAEANAAGHSPRMALMHYVNANKLKLKRGSL